MALKLFNDSGVAKLQAKDGEESITATADGAVKLYYDNAEKLATTSTGVDVTGTVTADSLTVNGSSSGTAKFSAALSSGGVGIDASSGSDTDTFMDFDAPDVSATDGDITYRFGRSTTQGSSDNSRIVMYAHNNTDTEAFVANSDGNLQFNSGYGSAATAYGVRAWVNFNASGTVSVRGSGNVSSVTDNGVGYFTINFATAMPDGNYSVGSWARNNTTTVWNVTVGSLTSLAAPSTTALPIFCRDDGRASVDPTYVTLNIIR